MNDFINMEGTSTEDQVTPQYGGQTNVRQQQCHSLLAKKIHGNHKSNLTV
jgi:hypothetical protein